MKSSEPVSRVLSPFILSEKDIPGAKLPKETAEECNCWELRRWLQCRGARTTGKKAALVQRCVFYMRCRVDINLSLFYGESLTVRMDFRICILARVIEFIV